MATHAIAGAAAGDASDSSAPPLCDEQGPIPEFLPIPLDPETGRIIWPSAEEMAARRAAALRMLDALGQITDEMDTDEVWREIYRNIDAGRPHRPLFEGLY